MRDRRGRIGRGWGGARGLVKGKSVNIKGIMKRNQEDLREI